MILLEDRSSAWRELLLLLVGGALFVRGASMIAGCSPAGKVDCGPEVTLTEDAEALLDQWRGDSSLLDKAEESLGLALQKNNRYAKAYVQLARLHSMRGYLHTDSFRPGSLEAAEKQVKKAIEIDPKSAEAYVMLGYLNIGMNRLSEAESALRTAEEIGTDSPWLRMNWAVIYEKQGMLDQAAEKYTQVIESKTTKTKALSAAYDKLRGYYIRKRNLVKAEEIYNAHVALEPEVAWVRGNYASELLFLVGDFFKAEEKAREALSLMEYGNARRTLAMALYLKWANIVVKTGDRSVAQAYFDEAQRLYPDLQKVRKEAMEFPATKIIVEALNSVNG